MDDQDKALKFYTEVLGFTKKTEVPVGKYKWLTVVSPQEPDGVELVLEPLGFEPAKVYQKALFEAGIPAAAFTVDNLEEEYKRLTDLNVEFNMPPKLMGPVKVAILQDTCGNNIQILEVVKP